MPSSAADPLHLACAGLPVPRRADQQPEDQPAPEHDLLDVQDLDAEPGQGVEDQRGDARPVLAGQRDQQGPRRRRRSVRHGTRLSACRRLSPRGRAGAHQRASCRPVEVAEGRTPLRRISYADTAPPSSARASATISRQSTARSRVSTRRASTRAGGAVGGRWRRFISRSGISGCHDATSRSTSRRVDVGEGRASSTRRLPLVDPRHRVRGVGAPHDRAGVHPRHQPDGAGHHGLARLERGEVELAGPPRPRGRRVRGGRARPGRRARRGSSRELQRAALAGSPLTRWRGSSPRTASARSSGPTCPARTASSQAARTADDGQRAHH